MLTIFVCKMLKISTNQESLIFVDILESPEKESEYPNFKKKGFQIGSLSFCLIACFLRR